MRYSPDGYVAVACAVKTGCNITVRLPNRQAIRNVGFPFSRIFKDSELSRLTRALKRDCGIYRFVVNSTRTRTFPRPFADGSLSGHYGFVRLAHEARVRMLAASFFCPFASLTFA